jgi:hypothetical protein
LKRTEIEAVEQKIVCLADVEAVEVEWVWPGYIPAGMVTILLGDPGIGKGNITMDLVARITTGRSMPNSNHVFGPGNVILSVVAEEDLARTIRPRLEAAGADCTRVHAFTEVVTIPEGISQIEQAIREHNALLFVVDPLNAYWGNGINAYKDQEVRKALTPLTRVAAETGAGILLVHHMTKGESANALYRGSGSIGIAGAARSVLMAAGNPQRPEERIIARVKGNLAATPPALAYTIETEPNGNAPFVVWHGTRDVTANDLAAGGATQEKPTSKTDEAVAFWKRTLADGPMKSTDVDALAKEEGIKIPTLNLAKKPAGVKSEKRGDGWWVSLPDQDAKPSPTSEPVSILSPSILDPTEAAQSIDQGDKMLRCQDVNEQVKPIEMPVPNADGLGGLFTCP